MTTTVNNWRVLSAFLLGLAACGGNVSSGGGGTTQPGVASPHGPDAPSEGPTPTPTTSSCDEGARTFAVGEGIPSAIAVDDRYVYWLTHAGAGSEGGTTLRASDKCGRGQPVTLATAPYFAGGLSVDAHGVYFSTARGDGLGSIGYLPKQQGVKDGEWTFGALSTWKGDFRPGDVKAGFPGGIFWVEPDAGVVAGISKANERVVLATGLEYPEHLAFDGAHMLVGTRTGVFRWDGASPMRIATGDVRGLAADPGTGTVYALTRDTAYRIERGQAPRILLASFPADVDAVAANSIELFFAHGPVVDIGAFPVDGGPTSQPMTTGGKGPGHIVADDGGLYFTAGGAIARVTTVHGR